MATLAAIAGAGLRGGKGLKFHAQGRGWIGSGWSWFGWYPPTAGTDLSPYDNLTFQIRVERTSPDALDPKDVSVQFVCSNGKKSSARIKVHERDANFDDGKWHKIVIPLTELTTGKDGAEFDPKTIWELRLSTWNDTPHDFNIYIDQIVAEK